MKSPGIIYRRYRQLKKKILYDKLIKARQRIHENCHYGKNLSRFYVVGMDPIEVPLCMFRYDPDDKKIELCTFPKECNAFICKWTKEKVIEEFEKELSDWGIKQKLYPDMIALEWVLDKDLAEAMKSPGWVTRLIISAIAFLERMVKSTSSNTEL